jgi:DNA-binding LytR/AlgR family response regulator
MMEIKRKVQYTNVQRKSLEECGMDRVLRIGICDDESHFRETLNESITKILFRQGIDHSVLHFSSGEELLNGYIDIDILFLDIQMDGKNGIDTAKEIRTRDENVCIIFISAFPEYAAEGYKVNAFRYITKPFDERELEAELTGAIREASRSNAVSLFIQNEKSSCRILTSNIVYIEVRGHKTVIHTTDDKIESNEALSKLEAKLVDQFFYRCHQGYLINLRYIDSVTENNISLRGDGAIPLSRYKKRGLMQMLTNYWGGLM